MCDLLEYVALSFKMTLLELHPYFPNTVHLWSEAWAHIFSILY